MKNYIPISRKLFEHQLWCEERIYSRFEAWLDILQSARFEDTKLLIGNKWIEVKRGQYPASLRFLSSRWGWSTKKVNAFLDCLIKDNMILKETPKETGQTLLTICNYDRYNSISENRKHQKKHIEKEEETLKETPFECVNDWVSVNCNEELEIRKHQRKQEGNTKETLRKQEGNKVNKEKKENKENNVSKRNAARAATIERKNIFYNSLISYLDKYNPEMIRAFFDYWCELNKSETKMRFELEKTWELPLRLQTWARRDKPKQNINQHPATDRLDKKQYDPF